MVVEDATEGMTDAPDRLVEAIEMVQQFVHQVFPVGIHREARVVPVHLQVAYPVLRLQGVEQLAVGGRGETVGVGEEDRLRHAG
ncbi:hypothetical protein D3C76_1060230 [compost metagenome]